MKKAKLILFVLALLTGSFIQAQNGYFNSSPTGNVNFGNDTIITSGAIKVGGQISLSPGGTGSPTILLNGITGVITSPSKTVSFSGDTIATTATVKASYLKADSVLTPIINLQDSVLTIRGPVALNGATMKILAPPVACGPGIFEACNGFAFFSTSGYNTPSKLGIGLFPNPNATLNIGINTSESYQFALTDPTTDSNKFTIDKYGNSYAAGTLIVGHTILGNTPAGYNLYVSNGILTEKVKIAVHTDVTTWSWPDYVLGTKYNLTSLNELEKYIVENNHLPDVPSATDVKKDGIDVASMDATLLKKVEELTLYILQQEKKIDQLEQKVDSLSKTNK